MIILLASSVEVGFLYQKQIHCCKHLLHLPMWEGLSPFQFSHHFMSHVVGISPISSFRWLEYQPCSWKSNLHSKSRLKRRKTLEFDGFQKNIVHWKALKIDIFDAVVVFPTTKIAKKKKKSPNMSENIPFFVWNPLNLKPIWIQKSGQEKNDQNPDTKKVWSLKLKFAVWWSGEQSATMKHRDWCWENWAATSKSVHHKVRQEMNNDKVNLPDSESCLWDFIDQVWRHDKTHEEEIFITIHQWAGLRKTHGIGKAALVPDGTSISLTPHIYLLDLPSAHWAGELPARW